MKRDLTEFEVEFEISTDLCREKPHEYDAKKEKKIEKFRILTKLEAISVCPLLRKYGYN